MTKKNYQTTKLRTISLALLLLFISSASSFAYHNKKEGYYKTYYADGALKSEVFYRDGQKEGSHKLYNKDGSLFSETRYNKNQKTYDRTQNQEGNTVQRTFKNSQVTHFKVYSQQNKLVEVGSFKNGLKHGTQKKFYPDGNIWIISPYVKGLKHGAEKQYYNNGQLQTTCQYKNGAKDGYLETFDKDGALKTRQLYINGKLKRQPS